MDLVTKDLDKLVAPLAQCFGADHDAAKGEHLLHYPQAEREAKIHLHRLPDDLGQEATRRSRAEAIIPADYSMVGRSGKLAAANLTLPL